MHKQVNGYMDIYIYKQSICIYVYISIRIFMYICTHIYTCIYIYTHM